MHDGREKQRFPIGNLDCKEIINFYKAASCSILINIDIYFSCSLIFLNYCRCV